MSDDTTQTTLRDQISENLDSVVEKEQEQVVAKETVTPDAPVGETAEQKAERLRDEKGRFTPKADAQADKTAKPEAKADAKVDAPVVAKARPQRPSSWKKDMWPHWENIDPGLAEYLAQREQEYAKGVSTYKNEWENAKPLIEAMAPFQPILQQYGIKPQEWITNLGRAHQMLALGTPQQKLQMFSRLAQDYQVSLNDLFVRDEKGQVYLNPQLQQQQHQPQQAARNPEDVRQIVQEMLAEQYTQREIQDFSKDREHFETVRGTMAGLLQSGLAEDLNEAYEAAIRHPRHADIFESLQQQQRQQDEKKRAADAKKRVNEARAKTISPKTATPSGIVAGGGKKGLRDQISESFDSAADGRV